MIDYILFLGILFMFVGMYMIIKVLEWTCGMCTCTTLMNGKVVIITGANSGIGYETAKDLAGRGARVILACRDEGRGLYAMNSIVNATDNNNVVYKHLDLTSLDSVRAFADDILRTESAIHVLINNAGTGKLDNSLTADRLPIEAQVNHFGPFLLTKLLLPLIKASAPSRIINVSSILHKIGKVDPENFHKQAKSKLYHMRVYSNTKLANMLFTRKLSKELKGSGVTANCLHPGGVHTDIFKNYPAIVRFNLGLLMKTPYQGAQTSIHLAVAPELEDVTDKYFVDCCEAGRATSAFDDDTAEKLWDLSERVVAEKRHIE